MAKSSIKVVDTVNTDKLGASYYCFCIEQALANVKQARALVRGDAVEENHELPRIQRLLEEALASS